MEGKQDRIHGASSMEDIQSTMLANLEATMGQLDPELLGQLSAIFLEDAPQALEELSRCIHQGDVEGLRKAAHSMKGGAASMGLTMLANHCLALEMAGREGNLHGTSVMLGRAEAEFAQVEKVLRDYAV